MKVEDIKVKVCLYVFDCLYLNGETLLQRPLSERRDLLKQSVKESSGQLRLATMKVRIINYSSDIYLLFRYSLLSTYSLIVVCTCSWLTQIRWEYSREVFCFQLTVYCHMFYHCVATNKNNVGFRLTLFLNLRMILFCLNAHVLTWKIGCESQAILILKSPFEQKLSIASCICRV